jgi:DNA repair exonuclease SbcCD ATPase subunit
MGGSAMAGLFDRLARQVLSSLGQRKTTQSKSKTVVVKPVKAVVPTIVPKENTKKDDAKIIDAWEKKMTTENITVENIPENSKTVDYVVTDDIPAQAEYADKDDYLLKQIDDFRAKAQQLQKLLITKESKVQELQEIVDEREVKAKELEYLLDERQRKADGITEEVTKQIDSLIDKVSEKMDAIGESLGQGLQDGQKLTERQIEELKDTLGTLNGQQMEEIKSTLGSLNAQQAEELKEALSELNAQLEVVKTDLSDKVHSENVQCYRNIADLLKSVDEKLDKANEIEKKVISTRRWTIAVMIFSLMNMAGIVFLALIALGIIK